MSFTPCRRASGAARCLAVIDRLTPHPASFDPVALRQREMLGEFDWTETVCWLGARLAEALDYAHNRGVVHRDIKPGNILLSQYGRPMLVDFNLAFQPLADMDSSASPLGGTLAYMAPEHLDAFNEEADVPPEAVAEAADIYSLGVVLYEMLAGQSPFSQQPAAGTKGEILRGLSAARRSGPEALPAECPRVLGQVVARCLDADPRRRFPSGLALLRRVGGLPRMPCRGRGDAAAATMADPRRAASDRVLIVLSLAPHVFGTIVNIAYNQIRIISHLSACRRRSSCG